MKWNRLTAVRFLDALTIAKFDLFGTPCVKTSSVPIIGNEWVASKLKLLLLNPRQHYKTI